MEVICSGSQASPQRAKRFESLHLLVFSRYHIKKPNALLTAAADAHCASHAKANGVVMVAEPSAYLVAMAMTVNTR